MDRRRFLSTTTGLAGLTIMHSRPISALSELNELPRSDRLPVLFIGHGSPMNAISDNAYTRAWRHLGETLPRPRAILCVSAHWLTRGDTRVTAMERPRTIHDFGGFPQALYDQQYPAPGSPELAEESIALVRRVHVTRDEEWGLDHGTWSVLLPMFPGAEIPVVQLSIDYAKPPAFHYALARELRALRDRGVLIVGSGNLVHNLREMRATAEPFDYAVEFEATMLSAIEDRNFEAVVDYETLGHVARRAHPTPDHFYPLLYSLGLHHDREEITTFSRGFDLGSISMACLAIGDVDIRMESTSPDPRDETTDSGS